MRQVKDTDNRDPFTTVLILDNDDKVEVNPVELFKNMVENCFGDGSDLDTSVLDDVRDFMKEFGS